MKKGWHTKRLGEVCVFDKAQGFHRDLPYVGLEHIESDTGRFTGSLDPQAVKSSTFRFSSEHVLYGRLRPYLNKALAPNFAGHCSTEIFPIKPTPTLSREYLLYWLLMDETMERINETCTGARMPRADMNEVLDFELPLPPLSEQRRIVRALDEAFGGFVIAEANAEKNLQNARALFESHLQSVFTRCQKSWLARKIGDQSLLEIIDGDRGVNYPKLSDFAESGHCLFLNTKNVRSDGFNFESRMFISADKERQLRKGKLVRGDVVLTTRGTIGNIGLYSSDVPFENVRINSGMLIFRPKPGVILSEYLFELLRSELVKGQIRKHTTGAAQPQLPIKTLVNFEIPVPKSIAEQSAIVMELQSVQPETQLLARLYEQKLAALSELKRSLLHLAFTGEL